MKSLMFSTPMVRALVEGRKCQTRRLVTPQPEVFEHDWGGGRVDVSYFRGDELWYNQPVPGGYRPGLLGPPCSPGDVIRVRESFMVELPGDAMWEGEGLRLSEWDEELWAKAIVHYRASSTIGDAWKWSSARHMPNRIARLFLTVEEVRREQLQSITVHDALAEGAACMQCGYTWADYITHADHSRCGDLSAIGAFSGIWTEIHGAHSWDANPWVWVIQFDVRLEA